MVNISVRKHITVLMHVLPSDECKRNCRKIEKELYLHWKSVLNRTYPENVCTFTWAYRKWKLSRKTFETDSLGTFLKITIIFLPSIEELGKVTPSLKHTSVERWPTVVFIEYSSPLMLISCTGWIKPSFAFDRISSSTPISIKGIWSHKVQSRKTMEGLFKINRIRCRYLSCR